MANEMNMTSHKITPKAIKAPERCPKAILFLIKEKNTVPSIRLKTNPVNKPSRTQFTKCMGLKKCQKFRQ
jgi:hypothetical protein